MLKEKNKKKKVFVGISGGVDSSVAALLLKNKGYEVTGVFIKVWQPDFIECTWKEDRRDAMRICAQLNIPFLTLDLEKEYKEGVIDYMIDEYKKGRTPNPDVFCNKEVKFGAFLDWAMKNGADYIATGHYAQNKNNFLHKAKDLSKDQSYFLWTLNKKQLQKIIFPIGGLLKTEIREMALKNDLATAKKKDSQGLCFIGKIDVKDFLKEFIKNKKGKIVDLDLEKLIGEHEGVFFYTIGEKINGKYIIKKDLEKNILYISEKVFKEKQDKIFLENTNFISDLKKGKTYFVQERYHAKETKIKIKDFKKSKEKIAIDCEFLEANNNFVYTPGQSLVFFDKNLLIGGGIMK